ncbi:hypothetical protein Lal_00018916, partial [Lupinus albus]
ITFILLILYFLTCLAILLRSERREIICDIFAVEDDQETLFVKELFCILGQVQRKNTRRDLRRFSYCHRTTLRSTFSPYFFALILDVLTKHT